jgi:hypothetical protein
MATSARQTQSGSDVSTTTRQPSTTKSTRVQPEQVSTVTQVGQPKSTTTFTAGGTTRQVTVEPVGFTLSFSVRINSSNPPKLLA